MKYISRGFLLLAAMFCSLHTQAQTGTIGGRVTDAQSNAPIEFATIGIQGMAVGTQSDSAGFFELTSLEPGLYNLEISCVGYKGRTVFEIQVTNSKPAVVDVALESAATELNEVVVQNSAFERSDESPVSLRTIGVNEIQRNPGGNRDISRVIQSLPGVQVSSSFRNDIIIRGGAPNENRFYIDDVEVPVINHFSTQGSSGGPVGMINVDFIKQVDFYSGAFPADRGNALSSVIEFKQKDARTDRLGFTATLGSSDLGLTLEGPVGEKQSFIFSLRRSYLQFLFRALELPFLPTYNDYQLKYKIKLSPRDELSIISLGALDNFELNLDANSTELQQYLLGYLPENDQWNYTIGAVYKHFFRYNFLTVVASRNMLDNTAVKYAGNNEDSTQLLNYASQESENKFRVENNYYRNGWRLKYGAGFERVRYANSTYQQVSYPSGIATLDFDTAITFNKYALFASGSRVLLQNRLTLSAGLRTDFSDYSESLGRPLEQLSPRVSASFSVTEKWTVNVNSGIYYQLPPYTVLGYTDESGNLVNKDNGVRYIASTHLVAGVDYTTFSNSKISLEGFVKYYDHYPFIVSDSVSLANLGADFGVIGNTEVTPVSKGRSYGMELLLQQKLYKGFYGIAAFTLVRSEFTNRGTAYAPSAWDSRFLVSLTAGKKFPRNWEAGVKWRFNAGNPYTPYDSARSSLVAVWDITGQGIPDYSRINTLRLSSYHQLDLRIDKKYFFKHFSLEVYVDIQNLYNYVQQLPPYLDVRRDENGDPLLNPENTDYYQTYLLENTSGNVLPSIGVVLEL